MDKNEISEKIRAIIERHDPLKLKRGTRPLAGEYDPEIEGLAIFMADASRKINQESIADRVLFVFKNLFTSATAGDMQEKLKAISDDIYGEVKLK